MVRNQALATSIHDAAWTAFAALLRSKAEGAGRACCVAVDPKHTSQTCSRCGWRNPALTLAGRVFHCLNPAQPDCRLVLDRDRNAACHILARGKTRVAVGRQGLPSG
jgi:putative transposase